MCGIAGYIGSKNATQVVYDQLKRLEYRGYDSAGIAYIKDQEISILKKAGKLKELGKILPENIFSEVAIAHSRWATHGVPNDLNAHPHYDHFDQIAIVHNGIIENYLDLKEELVKEGHHFHSETDTEVAAHIIGKQYHEGHSLEEAVRKAIKKFRGAYALVVISKKEQNKIVAARNASPIVLGKGISENMLASDIPALLPYTREITILEDDRIAVLTKDDIKIFDLEGKPVPLNLRTIDWDIDAAEKGGYEHFMLKEIFEQPQVIQQCLAGRLDQKGFIKLNNLFSDNIWSEIENIQIIGCGTAYNAGLIGKYLFEKILRIPVRVQNSSEFRYGDPVIPSRSLAIMISQSGETADTLAALKLCKERRIRTLGIINVLDSSIARECDRVMYTQAGPEISVASTKAYTAQIISLMLLVHYIAQVREMPGIHIPLFTHEINQISELAEEALKLDSAIQETVNKVKDTQLFFFTGRGIDTFTALEGALKLKEVAYVATQECSAGELKHGPLALIEKGVVSLVGATETYVQEKLVSNICEIQARGGYVIAFAPEDNTEVIRVADECIVFKKSKLDFLNALLSTILMQLFAYHFARIKGCEIDQPRNLAKSVTVE